MSIIFTRNPITTLRIQNDNAESSTETKRSAMHEFHETEKDRAEKSRH